ncbi:hypothetical protein AB9P05_20150 [Roseivirga sp. BDSF3-8]|uniref:hypothetical protein n=1 Tax=Roseivirga sp. BDSF3-8 TaxID=3241598 RepID=UPI0035320E26
MVNTKFINWDLYFDWVSQDRSFGDIRKDLELKGFDDDEIREIIDRIDDHITSRALNKSNKSVRKQAKIAGLLLFVAGLGTTAISLSTGYYLFDVLAFSLSATAVGIVIIVTGKVYEF